MEIIQNQKLTKEITTLRKNKIQTKKKNLYHLRSHKLRADVSFVAILATNCPNVDLKIASQKGNGSSTQCN